MGISVTYAVGKVANAWLKAGRPEDIASFKEVYDEARAEGMTKFKEFRDMDCKDEPLGDENKRFQLDSSQKVFDKVVHKVDDMEYKASDVARKLHEKLNEED